MVHTLAGDFAAEVAELCATSVTGGQWARFLDTHVPTAEPTTGRPLTGRAATLAVRKRQTLDRLYRHDPRVAPWAGTAHGVLQAVNTYDTHEGTIRGNRAERNSLKTINGEFARLDRSTWHTLQGVLTG